MDVLERIEKGEVFIAVGGIEESQNIPFFKELLRLAKLGQRIQWVSVAERLPDDGDYNILAYNSDPCNKRPIVMHVYDFLRYRSESITHWMPTPPNPGEGER